MNAVNSALDTVPRGQNMEPILAQTDEWSRNQTIALIYEWDEYQNENGETIRYVKKIKYPELHQLSASALSHLNMMVNLTWEDSRAKLLTFWSESYKRIKELYDDNDEALEILRSIKDEYELKIMASVDGTQQHYASMYSGGKRTLDVTHHEPPPPQ